MSWLTLLGADRAAREGQWRDIPRMVTSGLAGLPWPEAKIIAIVMGALVTMTLGAIALIVL